MFLFVEDSGRDLAMGVSLLGRLGAPASRAVDTAARAVEYLSQVEKSELPAREVLQSHAGRRSCAKPFSVSKAIRQARATSEERRIRTTPSKHRSPTPVSPCENATPLV